MYEQEFAGKNMGHGMNDQPIGWEDDVPVHNGNRGDKVMDEVGGGGGGPSNTQEVVKQANASDGVCAGGSALGVANEG